MLLLLQPPPMEQQMAAAAAAAGKRGARKAVPARVVTSIIDGLKQIYFHKVTGGAGLQHMHSLAAARDFAAVQHTGVLAL